MSSLLPAPLLATSQKVHAPAPFSPQQIEQLHPDATFVLNAGQMPREVRFAARGTAESVFFASNEIVVSLPPVELELARQDTGRELKDDERQQRINQALKLPPTVVRMRFDGANPTPRVVGGEQAEEQLNYFLGSDESKWVTDTPTYNSIVYEQLYAGIDVHYTTSEGQIKSTYQVAPEVDPTQIRWHYQGANRIRLENDALIIEPAPPRGLLKEHRQLIEKAPVAWQDINGQRVDVSVKYEIIGKQVGFTLGFYDPTLPLTIDPILTYSTFLGGAAADDEIYGVAVDSSRNIYVTGVTYSPNFPAAINGYDSTYSTYGDVFVTKIQNGVRVYSSFLGDTGREIAWDIAVESGGKIYITGQTESPLFPNKNAYDSTHNGGNDAFVVKLDPSFSGAASLVYSTFLGGGGEDIGYGIALNGSVAYVTGSTEAASSLFPTKFAYDSTHNGGYSDAFIARLNPSTSGSSSLVNSSFLGGSDDDVGVDIAVDSSGNAYVAGITGTSSGTSSFPILNGYDTTPGTTVTWFATKMSAPSTSNGALRYSTFLDGDAIPISSGQGIAVKVGSANKMFIAATTTSSGISTPRGFDTTYAGGGDIISVGLDTSKTGISSRVYATYIGGSGWDSWPDIAVEQDSHITITGRTNSAGDFAPISEFPMGTVVGGTDSFVMKFFVPSDTIKPLAPLFRSFIGGISTDNLTSVAVDSAGRVYIAGMTQSNDFPMVKPLQATRAGVYDGFVATIFPEYTSFRCRWPHTAGTKTVLDYDYALRPDLAIGQPWRTAYDNALKHWNDAPINMDFRRQTGAPILLTLVNDTLENYGGRTIFNCSGDTITGIEVRGNIAQGVSEGMLTHELGHAQGLGHIGSAALSILGTNPGTVTAPNALDIELAKTVYP